MPESASKAKSETQIKTNRLGGVCNPIVCCIPESAWEPTGDFAPDCDARTRLSCVVRLDGIHPCIDMHVDAFEVREDDDGFFCVVNPHLAQEVVSLWEIGGWEGERPETLQIEGRKYIVTMYPFAE